MAILLVGLSLRDIRLKRFSFRAGRLNPGCGFEEHMCSRSWFLSTMKLPVYGVWLCFSVISGFFLGGMRYESLGLELPGATSGDEDFGAPPRLQGSPPSPSPQGFFLGAMLYFMMGSSSEGYEET